MVLPRRFFWCAILVTPWAYSAHAQTVPACGQQLSANAIHRGVVAKSNRDVNGRQGTIIDCQDFIPPLPSCGVGIADVTCSYGDHYQCVEYVRRFYSVREDVAQRVDTSSWSHRNAVDYYTSPPSGFIALPNEGPDPPMTDDM